MWARVASTIGSMCQSAQPKPSQNNLEKSTEHQHVHKQSNTVSPFHASSQTATNFTDRSCACVRLEQSHCAAAYAVAKRQRDLFNQTEPPCCSDTTLRSSVMSLHTRSHQIP